MATGDRRPARGRLLWRAFACALIVPLAALAPGVPAFAVAHAPVRLGSVLLTVDDVFPNSPLIDTKRHELSFSLTVTSQSPLPLQDVQITGYRADPITTESQLNSAIKTGTSSNDLPAPPLQPRTINLAPYQQVSVTMTTTTSRSLPTNGSICVCHNAIYPIDFAAKVTTNGTTTVIASTQTYLPVFKDQPTKMDVTWVWPLLDRPHRLVRRNVFFDDDLAAAVAPGGRLDRLLTTLERVTQSQPQTRLTVLTDPELIDELAVMTHGYRVRTGHGVVPGTGGPAAQEWLRRLRNVLTDHQIELAWTPFGDPAVDALTRRRMSWSLTMDTAAIEQIQQTLGRSPQYDINWPVGAVAHRSTLSRLVKMGTDMVVLKDLALSAPLADPANALTAIPTGSGPITAAITSAVIQKRMRAVLDPTGVGLQALPALVAQMAIQVEPPQQTSHYLVIAPPRRLDVNPTVAARAIEATADSPWSRSIGLRGAIASLDVAQSSTIRPDVHSFHISTRVLHNLRYVLRTVPRLSGIFPDPIDAQIQLGGLRAAVQRLESTGLLPYRAATLQRARVLRGIVQRVRTGVSLVAPAARTYTLTSNDAELPITIRNSLDQDVQVRIAITQPEGFSASDLDRLHIIPAGSQVDVRVPTHVNHVGFIAISVSLHTPSGLKLGRSLGLTVRSTALGTIGIVITVVAGCVLAIALIVRLIRRLRARNHPGTHRPDNRPRGTRPARSGKPPPDGTATEPADSTAS